MDYHYHLLVETGRATLVRGMRHLGGVYTQRLNRRHGRVGHLFQGRYHAILVERDAHLLELSRYLLTEIAAHAGLHYSSVSKIIKSWEEEKNSRFKT